MVHSCEKPKNHANLGKTSLVRRIPMLQRRHGLGSGDLANVTLDCVAVLDSPIKRSIKSWFGHFCSFGVLPWTLSQLAWSHYCVLPGTAYPPLQDLAEKGRLFTDLQLWQFTYSAPLSAASISYFTAISGPAFESQLPTCVRFAFDQNLSLL